MPETNLIKQICTELNITQKQLAEKMGVAEITVSQWARGVNPLPKWAEKFMTLIKEQSHSEKILKSARE